MKIIKRKNIKNNGVTVFILKLISFKDRNNVHKYIIEEDYFKGKFNSKEYFTKNTAIRIFKDKVFYIQNMLIK